MLFEPNPRCLLLLLIVPNVSQGSVVFHSLSNNHGSSGQEILPNYDTKYSEKGKSEADSVINDDLLDSDVDKRLGGVGGGGGGGYPVEFFDNNNGMSWWPWQRGMAPVRRSYFVPRLGKRASQETSDDMFYFPCKDLSNLLEPEVTPAELEHIKAAVDNDSDDTHKIFKNLFDDTYDKETKDSTANDNENEICYWPHERDTRGSYSFVPRLGKKAYSFVPRLGKRDYSFTPRLGKRGYSFAPRLGKRKYSFTPRLGKKAYSFVPRLGKRAYSFVPRLGKKSSFVPRLGK